MHKQGAKEKTYSRCNTLRLHGFNYASKRVYFVTIVALDRKSIFLDERVARATLDNLLELRKSMRFNLYSYCLVLDHIHLLVGAGDSGKTLSEIVGAFKSLSTRAYWQWHEGRLWQRQFFDHIIRNEQDFFETIEYIKMNPVRKRLVEMPDEWPYTGGLDEMR